MVKTNLQNTHYFKRYKLPNYNSNRMGANKTQMSTEKIKSAYF